MSMVDHRQVVKVDRVAQQKGTLAKRGHGRDAASRAARVLRSLAGRDAGD